MMSKQKIPISSFELYFPEEIVLSGEKIADSLTFLNFTKPEPNLYTAEISGNEIEIDCTTKYLRRTTCECGEHTSRQACKHVIAGLFLYRRQKKSPTKIEVRKVIPQKVSMNSILGQLSLVEMEQFIKQQSYQNKSLAFDLKIQFAFKIPMIDEKAKYESLLTGVFRPYISKPNLSERKVKDLAAYLTKLFDHIYDLVVLKKWTDAVYLSLAIAKKTRFIHVKAQYAETESLVNLTSELTQVFEHILRQPLSPDLKRSLLTELRELVSSPNYRTINPLENLFLILAKSCRSNAQIDELIAFSSASTLTDSETNILLSLYLWKLQHRRSLLLPPLSLIPNSKIKHILSQLYHSENFPVLESLLVELISLPYSIEFKTLCFQYLKEARVSESEYPQSLYKSLWEIYVATQWPILGSWLLKFDPKKIKNSQGFIKITRIKEDSKSKLALAKVYIGTGNLDLLSDLLKNEIENRLLQRLIPDLLTEMDPFEILPFLRDLLDFYLSTHLGKKPWIILEDILKQIRKNGDLELADQLLDFITEKYQDRKSIVVLK